MADKFADFDGGSDAASGDDFDNAYLTTQKALTDALAGGRAFIKTDSAGTNRDTAASARSLTSPGTNGNPTSIFGCKSGTAGTGIPTNSDLVTRGDTDMPVFEATGISSDINMVGYGNTYGFGFEAGADFGLLGSANVGWMFENIKISIAISAGTNKEFKLGNSGSAVNDQFIWLKDCEVNFDRVDCRFTQFKGSRLLWHGGVLTAGSGVDFLFESSLQGFAEIRSVNLTAMGSSQVFVEVGSARNIDILALNCKIPASLAVTSGTWTGPASGRVRMHGCSTDTGLGSGDSVPDFTDSNFYGDIVYEPTAFRTNGADDQADGGFSYKMTPNADVTLEPFTALVSPPILGWIEGDGTAVVLTIFIANSSASDDYDDDGAWAEFFLPDALGTAQHDYVTDRMTPLATAAPQTDDTGSIWGTGANNHQKLVVTLAAADAPDYQGPVVGFVHIAKRQASPDSGFVDPLIEVT